MKTGDTMEIAIKGPGEIALGLVDSNGKLLHTKRIVISGDPKIQAVSRLPLTLRTRGGEVKVVALLISQSNRGQKVTFDGRNPATYTRQRCQVLKVSSSVISKARRLPSDCIEAHGGLFIPPPPTEPPFPKSIKT